MPILLSCTCGKKLRVGDDKAGKRIRCPGCQAALPVPAAAEPAEVEAAAVAAVPLKPKPAAPKIAPAKVRRQALDDDDADDRPLAHRADADEEQELDDPISRKLTRRRRDEDDDEFDEEPRTARKKQPAGGSKKILWLSLGGVAAIAAGVLVFILVRGNDATPGQQAKDPQTKKQEKAKDLEKGKEQAKEKEAPLPGGGKMSAAEAKARLTSQNNLKQMALGFHNYHGQYKQLPPADGTGQVKDRFSSKGVAGLSWRAHLLPSLEGDAILQGLLQGKFPPVDDKLESAWNRPDLKNKAFPLFADPLAAKDQDAWLTPYRVFVGPGAAFEQGKTLTFADFKDGTGTTILAVEAPPVPWTKPEELPYHPDQPLPKLGGMFADGFHALFADGHVRFIPHSTDEKTLRAMITRNGGEKVELPDYPLIDIDPVERVIAKENPPGLEGEPKESSFKDAANFMPMDLGNFWTYQVTGSGSNQPPIRTRMAQVERQGDALEGRMDDLSPSNQARTKEFLRQGATGLYVVLKGLGVEVKAMCILKYPVRIGEKWQWELDLGKVKKTQFFQVVAEETIQVPAGKFKTVRVDMTDGDGLKGVSIKNWFAPEVGMVKSTVNLGFGGPIDMELEKFEPKKKMEEIVGGKETAPSPFFLMLKVPGQKTDMAEPGLKYLHNRDYKIAQLPKAMDGAKVVLRGAMEVNDWLAPGDVILGRPATVYVAIMTAYNEEVRLTADNLQAFVDQGWTLEKEPFTVDTPEKWEFRVLSKKLKEGPVNLPLPKGMEKHHTQTIFAFKKTLPNPLDLPKIEIKPNDDLKKIEIKLPPELKLPPDLKFPDIKIPDIKLPGVDFLPGEKLPAGEKLDLSKPAKLERKFTDQDFEIAKGPPAKVFAFAGEVGKIYSFEVRGTINPVLRVVDGAGRMIKYEDGGGLGHSRLSFRPKAKGEYRVVVGVDAAARAGAFTLTGEEKEFQFQKIGVTREQPATVEGAFAKDDARDGQGNPRKVYALEVEPGLIYDFQAKGRNLYLRLENAEGNPIKNDDGSSQDEAKLVFVGGRESLVYLVVASFDKGTTQRFALRAAIVEAKQAKAEAAVFEAVKMAKVSGTLEDKDGLNAQGQPYRLIALKTEAGKHYNVLATSTQGGVELILEGPGGMAKKGRYTPSGMGLTFKAGQAAEYRLQVLGRPGGKVPFQLTIIESVAVEGKVEKLNWTDKNGAVVQGRLAEEDPTDGIDKIHKAFTFSGKEGATVRIDLHSKAFDPYLYLKDEDGKVLLTNDDNGESLDSRIVQALPRDGTYTILATSLGGQSAGPFTLTVREADALDALQGRIMKSMFGPREVMEGLYRELVQQLEERKKNLGKREASIARVLCQNLEFDHPKLALEAFPRLGKLLADAGNPDIEREARQILGVGRRLNLVGHTMEIKGQSVDDKQVDLAKLKGKVVLVEFWATWNQSSLQGLPNLKKLYAQHHDKGFEVVGVSLDDRKETLEKFVDGHKIAWPCILDRDRGPDDSLTMHYGVLDIPFAVLIDREGRVVSTNARGVELERLLTQLMKE